MALIVVPKNRKLGQGFSKTERIASLEHPGRRTKMSGYQSPAAWIGDLADSRKLIILCSFCKNKFNYKKNKYLHRFTPDLSGKTSGFHVNGKCDGCKQQTMRMGGEARMFIAEENWKLGSIDPSLAKRRAKAMWQRAATKNQYSKLMDDQINNPGKWGHKHNAAHKEGVKILQQRKLKVTDKRRFK